MKSSTLSLWGIVFAAVVLSSGCHPRTAEVPGWMKNEPRRPSKELVLVLTPEAEHTARLVRALRSELSDDFDVHVVPTPSSLTREGVGKLIRHHRPNAVVLVDNPTVITYADWARTQASPPSSIIVMSSFAEQLQQTVPNSTGIAFEPPAVTSLLDLRRLLSVPVNRVGVVYRAGFEAYVTRERARASHEKIELVVERVPRKPSAAEVHRALGRLKTQDIDALWVSNDNGLLSGRLLQDAWLPFVGRNQLPVIVGVPSLLDEEIQFGTYAAVPDIEGIGLQAADLIYLLSENDWHPPELRVQPPLSVKTYVDVESARDLGMSRGLELTVDVLIGRRSDNAAH